MAGTVGNIDIAVRGCNVADEVGDGIPVKRERWRGAKVEGVSGWRGVHRGRSRSYGLLWAKRCREGV
jgi:hypothetical protein